MPKTPGGADPERAFERLAEDEALRDDWEDDSYSVLLGWTANLAIARAPLFGSTDELYRELRSLTGGALEAAKRGDPGPLLLAAKPPLLSPEEGVALRAQALALAGNLDANLIAVVGRLATITGIPMTNEYR